MKYIVKLVLFCIFITTITTSCQPDVSLEPVYNPTTKATEGQLEGILAGVYNVLTQDDTYGQGLWGYLNGGADESFRNGINVTTIYPELYNISNSQSDVNALWRSMYKGIERANIFLDVIQRIEMGSVKKSDYIGQVTFLRAYYFYLLVNHFGDVPLKTKLSSDMGTDFNMARTPAKKVYEFIISEMIKADSLVNPINVTKTTSIVSRSAVEGILARVCLKMAGNPINDVGKYAEALKWSKKLINSNIHSLNSTVVPSTPNFPTTPAYSRLFINNMQNIVDVNNIGEGIFDAAYLSKSNTSGIYESTGYVNQRLGSIMGVYCPSAAVNGVIGYSQGTYRVFPKLYNLYGSGDLRRDWAISPYVYKDNTTTKYYNLDVKISGGGGFGASATAVTSSTGVITSIIIDNPGTSYVSTPSISIIGYNTNATTTAVGTGATAVATISGGKITAIAVTNGGSGYPSLYERCVGKWRREYEINLPSTRNQNYTSCNFPIIRYADVLLMAAEADLQVNNGTPSAEAVEYYNLVRRRAYGFNPTTSSTKDVSTFTMQDIIDERSRELCFEGLRRSDLLRWGIMPKVMQDLFTENSTIAPTSYVVASTTAAKNYLLNPTKYSLLPIPNSEIRLANLLVQNSGW